MGRHARIKAQRRWESAAGAHRNDRATNRTSPARSASVRFVGRFLALFFLLQIAYYGAIVGTSFFHRYLSGVCRAAGLLLAALGETVTAHGDTLSARFSMSVASGCDGLQPVGILAVAVIAFPGSIARKIAGVAIGAALLLALNVVRVAALYWIGAHAPSLFDVMHVHVWPALLVAAALAVWLSWVVWTTPRRGEA